MLPTAKPHEEGARGEGAARARGEGAGCKATHRAEARRRDGDIAPFYENSCQ